MNIKGIDMARQCNTGFTMIELMIVIVIIAILASIAFPSYQNQVQKTRRADGIALALEVAQAQERFFTKNHQYADDIQAELGYSSDPAVSEEGHYTIAIVIPGACVVGGVNNCFTVTATAVGVQANDASCATFTINDRGQKTSANGGGGDTTGECW